MTTNSVLMKEARSHLGKGGAVFRKWAGIGKNDFYCNAFVSYCLAKTDNEDLYCEGRKEINCPHSMDWCIKNLAAIPIYIALEGDVTYLDWEPNGLPNHVGFVEERIDADKYHTIEGNTSGAIVARRERNDDQEQLTFRLHYTPTPFSADKKLEVDGLFGYNSIAVMQKWLGVDIDAILGQKTLKALQKKLGVTADALWGTKTTKALQKLVGAEVDGLCGPDTVKAFQKYLNAHAFEKVNKEVNIPITASVIKTDTWVSDANEWARKIADENILHYVRWKGNVAQTHKCPICSGVYEIYKNLKTGTYKVGSEGETVKWIQKFLKWAGSKLTIDGEYGQGTAKTVRSFQKKHGLKVDGIWGTETHKKAKAVLKDVMGMNCIGGAFMVWHHGGKLGTKCNCGVISNEQYNQLLKVSQKRANELASKWTGKKAEVIRNGGKAIPLSMLKAGYIIVFYHGNEYYHTGYYMGNGKYFESNTTGGIGSNKNVRADLTLSNTAKANIKVAIRYIDKCGEV